MVSASKMGCPSVLRSRRSELSPRNQTCQNVFPHRRTSKREITQSAFWRPNPLVVQECCLFPHARVLILSTPANPSWQILRAKQKPFSPLFPFCFGFARKTSLCAGKPSPTGAIEMGDGRMAIIPVHSLLWPHAGNYDPAYEQPRISRGKVSQDEDDIPGFNSVIFSIRLRTEG
jgi:hypothetical protein